MDLIQAIAPKNQALDANTIRQTLADCLSGRYTGQKVLVLIPDHTRTIPLPQLFRDLVEVLHATRRLDFMVALGTHPPLSETRLVQLVGITAEERQTTYRHVGLLNHTWDQPDSLTQIGVLPQEQVQAIAGDVWHPSLDGDVPVNVNRATLAFDHILILGPTFPHEVVGFSGGAKYLFPGISGPEMINATHWLGALSGVVQTIGIKDTPVRALIHAAAAKMVTPVTLIALVVVERELAGLFIGHPISAWDSAANLSAQCHIRWCSRPFQRVLSCAPQMYDELWTAAKAMYKLESAVAAGGEVIIYAPHLDTVSRVHGKYIYEIGYHILPYFLRDWERYKHIPLGILAHSTHLRGSGKMTDDVEQPNVRVTLASRISAADCAHLNLGYLDPGSIDFAKWQNREDEGILYVPKAGEILYRLKERG